MVECCGARYVSLHVRVSNMPAIRLYRDTLGFKVEKVEPKYYADGEDAYSMKLDLEYLREEVLDGEEGEGQDEGEEVGEAGAQKEKLRKVKIGRQLGVGDLVERNEARTEGS
jgi:N-alpha-acetyltransferase 10/11